KIGQDNPVQPAFIGGGIMITLGQNFPELVRPFSHGIPMDPGKPYIYIGALYNLFWCFTIGFVVSLFTKPKDYKLIEGLTVWTIKQAKMKFKGGEPNEVPGKKAFVNWKTADLEDGVIRLTKKDMGIMKANEGDLVYLCDKRSWLGGLKSVHGRIGEPHDDEGRVYLNAKMADSGMFIADKLLYAEKEM
ncbi:MAG: sodium:solute symporter family protein, partial [FCB group bacterium]|nr:sodium:solute symporter family protein [FCB group bacterium]